MNGRESTKRPVSLTGHFGPLLASAISDNPNFAAFIHDWRENDQRDRRASPRFVDFATPDAMRERVEQLQAIPHATRPHAWSEEHRELSWDQPCKALGDHARAPAAWARRFGLDPDELFAYLRGSAAVLSMPGAVASMTGAPSSAFAYVYGDASWPAGTRRRAYTRQLERVVPDGTIYTFQLSRAHLGL